MHQTLTLTIPRRLILSSNDRRHYHDHRRRVADLRALAATAARHELTPMHAATLDVVIGYPDRRRRDTPNMWPTIKPILDGIVTDARMLPDDDDEHLPSVTFRRSVTPCPRGYVAVTLVFDPIVPTLTRQTPHGPVPALAAPMDAVVLDAVRRVLRMSFTVEDLPGLVAQSIAETLNATPEPCSAPRGRR